MKPAAKSEFGKPLVNSVFTFGLMIGVSVERHHARHAGRQPRLRQARNSPIRSSPATRCAAKPSASRVRESKSRPECRDRHLGAPQLQPARRAGVRMHPHRAAAQEARNERAPLLAVRPGGQREEGRQGDRERGRRDHLRSRGQRRACAKGGGARNPEASARRARAAATGGCGSIRSAASITRTISN